MTNIAPCPGDLYIYRSSQGDAGHREHADGQNLITLVTTTNQTQIPYYLICKTWVI